MEILQKAKLLDLCLRQAYAKLLHDIRIDEVFIEEMENCKAVLSEQREIMKKIVFPKHSASSLLKNRTERFILERNCSGSRLNNYLQFYSKGSSPNLTKASSKTSRCDMRPHAETDHELQLSNIYMKTLFSKKQTPMAANDESNTKIPKDTSKSRIEETLKSMLTRKTDNKRETFIQSRSSRLLELKTSPAHRVSKDYFMPHQTSNRPDPAASASAKNEQRKAGLKLTLLPSRSFAKIPLQSASSLNNSLLLNPKPPVDRDPNHGSASKHRKAATFDRARLEAEIETIYENLEEDSQQPNTALHFDLQLSSVKQDLNTKNLRTAFPKKLSEFNPTLAMTRSEYKKQSEAVLQNGKENAILLGRSQINHKQNNSSLHLLTK